MEKIYTFDPLYQKLRGNDINGADLWGMKILGLKNARLMMDILDLSGKVAIVTGGAMGLGLCVVNRLCEAGACVVIADLATEYADDAVAYFASKSQQVKFIHTDIREISQIEAAVAYTVKEFGKIDILVNDAAIWRFSNILELTEEKWDAVVDTNLKGTVFFIQAVVRQIVKQGQGGKIVNIASIAGLSMETPYGWLTSYVASKSGVVGISQSLAKELKPLGININCVLPGGMITPGNFHVEHTPALAEITQKYPRPPMTDPDEVARVVYTLTTGISDYMHGATVVVDGGARWMINK